MSESIKDKEIKMIADELKEYIENMPEGTIVNIDFDRETEDNA